MVFGLESDKIWKNHKTGFDNYSEDNTEEAVKSYKDNRIKYIKFRNNGVVAASRNTGIKSSKGEYVSFLDSDDLWLPDKLEKQVKFFNEHPAVSLVYAQAEQFMTKAETPIMGLWYSGQAEQPRPALAHQALILSGITGRMGRGMREGVLTERVIMYICCPPAWLHRKAAFWSG